MVNGDIAVLDYMTLREVARFQAFDQQIGRIAFTPDDTTLFAATVEEMRIWKADMSWAQPKLAGGKGPGK